MQQNQWKEEYDRIKDILEKTGKVLTIDFKNYTADQLKQFRLGLTKNVDVELFAKTTYTADQMKKIRMCLEAGLVPYGFTFMDNTKPVSMLGALTRNERNEVLLAKQSNLNIEEYADGTFNYRQLRQIRYGLLSGVDVATYAKPEFDDLQMCEIRMGLERNLNVSVYAKKYYNADQMMQIRLGLEDGLKVDAYLKRTLDPNQMKQIRLGIKSGVDISRYSSPDNTWEAMSDKRTSMELKRNFAIEHGRHVTSIDYTDQTIDDYKNKGFDAAQLNEIKLGLDHGINVGAYTFRPYNAEQMRELRLALEDGINVVRFSSISYKASEMRAFRIKEFLNRESSRATYTKSQLEILYCFAERVLIFLKH